MRNGSEKNIKDIIPGEVLYDDVVVLGIVCIDINNISDKNFYILNNNAIHCNNLFVSNDEKFNFHTYLVVVKKEFLPNLNDEHDGYAWTSFGKWPKTLHQGLRNTLQNKTNLSKLETVFQVIDLLEE